MSVDNMDGDDNYPIGHSFAVLAGKRGRSFVVVGRCAHIDDAYDIYVLPDQTADVISCKVVAGLRAVEWIDKLPDDAFAVVVADFKLKAKQTK